MPNLLFFILVYHIKQLKTISESFKALNTINKILEGFSNTDSIGKDKLEKILKDATRGFSTKALENAISKVSNPNLNESVIRGMLADRYKGKDNELNDVVAGLTGNVSKNTVNIDTNTVARQKNATVTDGQIVSNTANADSIKKENIALEENIVLQNKKNSESQEKNFNQTFNAAPSTGAIFEDEESAQRKQIDSKASTKNINDLTQAEKEALETEQKLAKQRQLSQAASLGNVFADEERTSSIDGLTSLERELLEIEDEKQRKIQLSNAAEQGRIFTDNERVEALTQETALTQAYTNVEMSNNVMRNLSAVATEGQIMKETDHVAILKTESNAVSSSVSAIKNKIGTLGTFQKAALATTAVVAVISAVSYGILKVMDAVTTSYSELQERAKKASEAYKENSDELEKLNDELNKNKSRIDELKNKGSLTILEKEELTKLEESNKLLEEQISLRNKILQQQIEEVAKTTKDELNAKIYGRVNDDGTNTKGTLTDSVGWNIEDIKEYESTLSDLKNEKVKIEKSLLEQGVTDFSNNIDWVSINDQIKDTETNVNSLKNTLLSSLGSLSQKKESFMVNGKIISGYEDIVKLIDDAINAITQFNEEGNKNSLIKVLKDSGVGENDANDIANGLTTDEIKQTSELDILPYIDENATVESVREAIKKAQEEADKNPVDGTVTFTKDPTDMLRDSDDKDRVDKNINLADLKNRADIMKTIQSEIQKTGDIGVDTLQKLSKQYPEAKEALYDYMTGVKNEQELFNELKSLYDNDKNEYVKNLAEKNQANEDFFASIKQNYPEVISVMKSLVEEVTPDLETLKNKYISDIATEEEAANQFISALKQKFPELYNQLADIYDNDKENFIKHVFSENETNQDFLNFLSSNYPKLFDLLGTMYGNDVDNWSSMEQAKAKITTDLINQLNALWTQYFEGISDTFNAFGSIMENADGSGYTFVGGQDDSDSYDHNMSEEEWQQSQKATSAYDKVKDKINSAIKIANEAVVKLQDSSYNQIENSIGGLDWDDLGSDSSSSSGSDSGSDSSDKDNSKDYDLIERKIKKLESAISALDTAVSDTYTSWGNRNSALADELSSVSDEIALQQQAYQRYMDLADSVGLDGYYEDLIKNGAMDVVTVDDENLQDQIDKFQDFYDKAQDCNDKIRDLNQNLKELQKTKFDNVVSQFEDISSSISHVVTMLDKYIDLADKHGYYASPELYQKQLEQYNNTLNTLTSERDTLQSKLQESVQSGLIEEGAEAWNDMLQQIQSVNEEIVDTVVNIQEVGNSLRDLNFTIFERGQDNISNLVNEGQFYVDLLDKMNKDLYDDDGKITNEGLTVQGIHSENYAAYLKQADFYAKEISAIEAELANDPANTTLIDKKQEYIEAQRESVLAAYDEKNAIIDLIKDGYDKASDALSKLIDKRKEALEAEKDLHDYQKSVQEKSDKVTELEKQKNAYANDTSEEAKSKVQQLEVNLKEAQEDLAETEYDKYISDQEKLLDDLQTEYEDLINDRIDNIDKELGDVADAVNLNRDAIRSTLENLSQDTELPLTKAMRDVWNSATPVVDLNTTVQGIGSTVSGITLAINDIITRLNDLIAIMRGNLDSEINNYDDGSYNPNNSTPAPTPSYEPDPEPSYSYDESDDSDSGDAGNYDDLFVYKYYYPQPLDTEHSVVDRLKSNNIDASWDRRADYYEGIFGDEDYTGSDYQNIRMLDWLKEHGYAKGKKRGEYSTGYHLVGEEGNEFMITNGALREVGTEDTIFTADMAKNIADFSVDPTQYLSSHMPLPNVKPASIPNNVTSNVDTIEISLPNVTNYTEFKTQLMNDRGFKSYISEATLGVALGHNELAANKYK